ncbi:MAG: Deoxyribose-phosphate aldolase [Candidatus Beckwithbacteria bacterium GW2011_GWA2_43_10]|uniref:Deoxyribose-phosphate aldolase n=1 Tax=Candidatus Beckwithbacteria bacterium GW2011_GWA2_43_10 TaxID=1618369 RepID=A0A0G1E7W8_9BACT|nr:MAG: Deoxyribose-phosphate aldolase [Candidatus Beckwithbacteria bacterium GW2011_GWA2_43_10]
MDLNSLIDHTLLKPTATKQDIIKLCAEAKAYGFWSVCVNPVWVKLARKQGVRVCSVIGFPLGANTLAIKTAEIKQAVADGADELDIVINQAGNILEEVRLAVKAAEGKIVKIIIETCYLTDKEKISAAKLVKAGGADFVKTSTGFGSAGATVEDIRLLRKIVGSDFGVKASGGIKTREQAEAMIKAGANRIGTSSGIEICR